MTKQETIRYIESIAAASGLCFKVYITVNNKDMYRFYSTEDKAVTIYDDLAGCLTEVRKGIIQSWDGERFTKGMTDEEIRLHDDAALSAMRFEI